MRGRKPKPTAVKVLAGNPGKRALNTSEPRPPVPDSEPYAPRHLNADAKKEWRRVVAMLIDLGLYTEIDQAALAIYCQTWGRWVVAERKCTAEGEILITATGYAYQNPWRSEANKAIDQMRRIMVEFGMTPSSRSRINMPGEPEGPTLAEQLFAMVNIEQGDADAD